MSDREIICAIDKIFPGEINVEFRDEFCIKLELANASNIFTGVIRHASEKDKQVVLELISRLIHLEYLNLEKNLLRAIPKSFKNLTKLKYLNLRSNLLQGEMEWLPYLTRIEHLNLGANEFRSFPEEIIELTKLKVLHLHKNKFNSLDERILTLSRLETLNLYGLFLKPPPQWLCGLTTLKSIALTGWQEIPEEIKYLKNLEFFTNCIATKLKKLPTEFCGLSNLRMARLFQNNLEQLPDDFGQLLNLEQLSLYQNQLSNLPDSFSNLKKLKKLNIGWNSFTVFPKEIYSLSKLEWLGIYKTDICVPNDIDGISVYK